MRVRLLFVLLGAVILVVSMNYSRPSITVSPEAVVDYCAYSISGEVRAITSGACRSDEWSLGRSSLERSKVRPKSLDPQLISRFLAAQVAGRELGYELSITSGYRSIEYQEFLFQRAIKRHGSEAAASKWVLPPEKSNHPWGMAIDVNYLPEDANAKDGAAWLEASGYQFGLCRRYQNEWWHFEPLVEPGIKCPNLEPYPS
jgi:hypothetical protein